MGKNESSWRWFVGVGVAVLAVIAVSLPDERAVEESLCELEEDLERRSELLESIRVALGEIEALVKTEEGELIPCLPGCVGSD